MKATRVGRCLGCGVLIWRESYSYPSVDDSLSVVLLPPEFSSGHICPKADTPKPTAGSK